MRMQEFPILKRLILVALVEKVVLETRAALVASRGQVVLAGVRSIWGQVVGRQAQEASLLIRG